MDWYQPTQLLSTLTSRSIRIISNWKSVSTPTSSSSPPPLAEMVLASFLESGKGKECVISKTPDPVSTRPSRDPLTMWGRESWQCLTILSKACCMYVRYYVSCCVRFLCVGVFGSRRALRRFVKGRSRTLSGDKQINEKLARSLKTFCLIQVSDPRKQSSKSMRSEMIETYQTFNADFLHSLICFYYGCHFIFVLSS